MDPLPELPVVPAEAAPLVYYILPQEEAPIGPGDLEIEFEFEPETETDDE